MSECKKCGEQNIANPRIHICVPSMEQIPVARGMNFICHIELNQVFLAPNQLEVLEKFLKEMNGKKILLSYKELLDN